MRILYVGALDPGQTSLQRMQALQTLDVEVVPLNVRDHLRSPIFSRLADRLFVGPAVRGLNRALVAAAEHSRPDLAWIDRGHLVTPRSLREISARTGARLVHLNPDDPFGRFHRQWRLFVRAIPAYDLHFVSRRQNLAEYRERGARRVHGYDRSYSPDLHRPVELTAGERRRYETPVGFIGSWAPARAGSMRHLVRHGVPLRIYGPHWGRATGELRSHVAGGALWGEEYPKAICGMQIALHFLRRENRDEQDSRSYEIPATGTFMLAERSPTHESLFQDGVEAVFFDDDEDLLRKVRHYLERPDERRAIAEAGRRRCQRSGYDHRSRMEAMLRLVRDELGL